jgi:hypothetical protein
MIISVRSPEEVGKLGHLRNKKNILARFVMEGCHWCEESQPEWDSLCMQAKKHLDSDTALAEIESSFVHDFNRNQQLNLPIRGYPTIIFIKSKKIIPQQARDAKSLIKVIKFNKSRKNKPSNKTRKRLKK